MGETRKAKATGKLRKEITAARDRSQTRYTIIRIFIEDPGRDEVNLVKLGRTCMDEEELNDRIDRETEQINQYKEWLDEGDVVESEIKSVYQWLAISHLNRAIYEHLTNGDNDVGDDLENAANYYVDVVEKKREQDNCNYLNDPNTLLFGLYASLLVNDTEISSSIASRALKLLDLDGVFPDQELRQAPWYHWAKCLAHLILNENDDADTYLVKLRDAEPPKLFDGIPEYGSGLLNADENQIQTGLSMIIERYYEERPASPDSGDDLVSLKASGLFALARRRGLEPNISGDSLLVPDA